MACYSPLDGFRSRELNESGKRSIVFDFRKGFQDMPVTVPCGQCIGCRLEKSRQWAMRCVHEASLYDDNCFITLTYNDDNLPADGGLDKSAFPKFMKRLRKRFSDERIRYYHCGEYGGKFHRPHYHALLFGFDLPDKNVIPSDAEYPVWESEILEDVWGKGFTEVGSVNFDSASYVTQYVTQKVVGSIAPWYYDGLEPEYATMSRRPGIGSGWYEQFKCEVYAADSVIVKGKEVKPPRFYDFQFESTDPARMAAIKRARVRAQDIDEQRSSRLLVRREVLEASLKIKERDRC